jgi:hypothetical protein
MRPWFERFKPRASGRVQIGLAAGLWSVVGSLLLFFGARWTLRSTTPGLGAGLVAAGVCVGLLKGRFVLDRTALRITGRIAARGDGHCAGGFLSLRSWLLVALMATAGRILRGGLLPLTVVGPLYTAIGAGLLFSSRIAWLALGRPRAAAG